MTDALDIHPASDAERVELFRNVFDVWPMRETVEEHVQARLNSVQHRRANWWVGCVDGRVAVSLGAFPLQFRLHGEVVPGIAIGAVHCHADFRGRGYAPALMAEVERRTTEAGGAISMLYSDIKPEYYARMGYLECPSWEMDLDGSNLPTLNEDTDRLGGCDSAEDIEQIRALYERCHQSLPFSIHRGDDYWSHLLAKTSRDRTYLIGDSESTTVGYFRVGLFKGVMTLTDCALATFDDRLIRRLFSAVVAVARSHRVKKLQGWIPGRQPALAGFNPARRQIEITMVKPLRDEIKLSSDDRAAADWFHEIDHV